MERMTDYHVGESSAYMRCSGNCRGGLCENCEELEKMIDRLAAYEDTGLDPEEITTEPYGCVFYCNRKCNLDGDFCAEGPGCPYEINADTAKHLLELAQAEKDGRLVVLPFCVGAPLYEATEKGVWEYEAEQFSMGGKDLLIHATDKNVWYKGGRIFGQEQIGKTVFLTREEAEAALKKREEDNEAD